MVRWGLARDVCTSLQLERVIASQHAACCRDAQACSLSCLYDAAVYSRGRARGAPAPFAIPHPHAHCLLSAVQASQQGTGVEVSCPVPCCPLQAS
jgi:hypothetical protein